MSNQEQSIENPIINITVTFRHTESTEALKAHAIEKLTHCIQRYVQCDAEGQVVLCIEKLDHTAEIKVQAKNYDLTAKATTKDLYSAIDKAIEAISKQFRRQKDRNTDHHRSESIEAITP